MEAVSYLKGTEGLRLVIIGGDEDSDDAVTWLKEITGELNLKDRVTFHGLVKHSELPLYYSAADVTVVPSYYESFGLVALESLACGTPVVATDVGDMSNIIRQGETGYVVPDNDPRELADKISTILSKSNNKVESALAIRESINRYDWSNIAEMISKEFYQVSNQTLTSVA